MNRSALALTLVAVLAGCGGSHAVSKPEPKLQRSANGALRRFDPERPPCEPLPDGGSLCEIRGRRPHLVRVGLLGEPWRPGPVWCPLGSGGLDVRSLVRLRTDQAEHIASEHGCTTRIVGVNGQRRPITLDFVSNRLDLEIAQGIVTGADVG